jgi:hypothetical protein
MKAFPAKKRTLEFFSTWQRPTVTLRKIKKEIRESIGQLTVGMCPLIEKL